MRPGSTAEVAELVRLARAHGVPLVPQGGNTGLVAGGVPLAGEVVVSLGRLRRLDPVDRLAAQLTAGAGVTLATLAAHADAARRAYGVDLGSRASATVGGMVATNAGGLHVVRHGAMRAQVVGVEAVLGTGEVISRLGGLVKDNTGYDLAQLLCGSEGTIGIVTAARLRLVPRPRHVVTALAGVASIEDAVALAAELRWALPEVLALEMMTGPSLRLVAEHLGAPPPVAPGAGAYLIVEAGGAEDPLPHLAGARRPPRGGRRRRGHRAGRPGPPVALAGGAPEAGARFGVVHKLDVTLPAAELAGFCHAVVERVAAARPTPARCCSATSATATHVNVAGPAADDEEVDDLVLALVVERGRSISAEHGIGTLKRRWLGRDLGRGGRHAGGEAGARPRRRAEPPRRAARDGPAPVKDLVEDRLGLLLAQDEHRRRGCGRCRPAAGRAARPGPACPTRR